MVARIAFAAGALLYPLIVYAGLRTQQVRAVALVLGALLALRLLDVGRRRDRHATSVVAVPIVAVGVVIAVAGLLNDGRLFLFVPVLVNLTLLVVFGRTLRRGPSMVEALARLQYGALAPGAVPYCRRVTVVWCAFFTVNIAIISTLALTGRLSAWALYTGIVAYVVMAGLFTAELTYRSWRFRHYSGAATDVVFRRLFPPRSTA
jgi:uncharacterized membrane protein